MIWTNKGLKQRVSELEDLVTSLNVELTDAKSVSEARAELCDSQHERIKSLLGKVESLSKTSPNVVVPLQTPAVEKLSVGKRIARSLKGQKP